MTLDLDAVQAGHEPGAFPFTIEHVAECSSTQDLALEAARAGRGAGHVVSTDFQRSGRGRAGSAWIAPPGSALLVSVLLEPAPPVLPLTPLLAGVAVVDGIAAVCGLQAELKWPNDVMVRHRKLAGILVEHPPGRLVVVGLGVNVSVAEAALPPGATATSLSAELGRPVSREALLAAILSAIRAGLIRAERAGPAAIIADWRRRSSMLGRRIAFDDGAGERTGVASDLLEDGALLVRLDDGTQRRLLATSVRRVRPR